MTSTQLVRPVQGILFDCDGCLLDSMGLWLNLETNLAASQNHVLTEQERVALNGYTLQETATFFHETLKLGTSSEEVDNLIRAQARSYYRTRAHSRPGALEFVGAVHRAGIPAAVVSSTPHDMLEIGLSACGFAPLIDIIVSCEDVGTSKRSPAPYLSAANALGCTPDNTWVFDDSAYALATAAGAGFHTIGMWDNDAASHYDDLERIGDAVFRSWSEIDIEVFLRAGYVHSR